jgi:RND family efflux transporter MFP subunit
MPSEDLSKLKIEKSAAVAGPRKRKKLYRSAAAVLVVLLLGILYLKGVFTPAAQVEVATVSEMYPSQTFTLLNASGYVVAQRKAAVASKATGRLVELSVEEGSKVKKGDIVARLESGDVVAAKDQAAANLDVSRSNLDQAKAELRDARLEFDRSRELVAKGYIAQTDFDSAEARYKKAVAGVSAAGSSVKASKAALQAADVAIEYTLIRAPFDAVVLTKDADIGDMVTPFGAAANAKAAVVTIADMGSLQVEVDVSESNIEKVKVGEPCEIQLDALPESRFPGKVHMIVPTADRSKATVLVKVAFADKDRRILPEMSAKVAFLERPVGAGEEKPRTVLNPSSVVTRGDRKTVFVFTGGRAVETPVELGHPLGDMVEVVSGVKAGDKVVLKPSPRLRTGAKIKTAEQ